VLKVGDLIKPTDYWYRNNWETPSFGLGIVVAVAVSIPAYLIQWSNGRQSWQTPRQIEVINESR